jgi:hypothetical protein
MNLFLAAVHSGNLRPQAVEKYRVAGLVSFHGIHTKEKPSERLVKLYHKIKREYRHGQG